MKDFLLEPRGSPANRTPPSPPPRRSMSRGIIMLSFIALFFCQCTNSSVYQERVPLPLRASHSPPPLSLFSSTLLHLNVNYRIFAWAACSGAFAVLASGSTSISVLVRWFCLSFGGRLLIKLGDKRKRALPPPPPPSHTPPALCIYFSLPHLFDSPAVHGLIFFLSELSIWESAKSVKRARGVARA